MYIHVIMGAPRHDFACLGGVEESSHKTQVATDGVEIRRILEISLRHLIQNSELEHGRKSGYFRVLVESFRRDLEWPPP